MRVELLQALETISEGMTLLRAQEGRSYEQATTLGLSRLRDRVGADPEKVVPKRFGRSRTHKAHSAEAILKHVLRQRGWTAAWRRFELTGKQHLNLLEDVRQYSRMYLRHEAESFFDEYGVEIEDASRDGGREALVRDSGCLGEVRQGSIEEMARWVAPGTSRGIASRAAGALSRFFDRAKGFIREVIVAGAMALKGDDPLTNAEIYALDRLTKKQYDYLNNFEREVARNPPREIADLSSVITVEPPPMTPGQFIARLESYGNAPWEVQNVGREIVRNQEIFKAERRVHLLSMAEHRPCKGGEQGCLEQSQLGWQPIGTLREIGDCFCMNNCDCYFEWQDPKGRIYVSPWGRHNPKGFNQPGAPGAQLPGMEFPVGPAIPKLPSGPGPQEKTKKKIKLEPAPKVGGPYPKGGTYPPLRPDPTIQEIIDEAGSPHSVDYYEEL